MTHRLAIATLIGLALLAPRAEAGTPCDELLADQAYRCQVRTAPDALPSERCLWFAVGSRGIAVDRLSCSCTPRGKITKVAFDASAEFACAGSVIIGGEDPYVVDTTMSGVATRSGIKRGFSLREDGLVEAFECVLDPTCVPTPE